MSQTQRGFTLVELSIVLVILGLLVGGVLSGQSLIRASELRSVTTQYQGYLTAVNAFKDKYFALPGDMTNAISFWGAAHATPATCATTVGTGTQTCNGDGDGLLNQIASTSSNEQFRFWQQLANAGLIAGTYNGVQAGGLLAASTANSPSGKIGGTLWYTTNWGNMSGYTIMFDGAYGNVLMLGMMRAGIDPGGPAFKPEELWNIDTKIDDGKPATGIMGPYGTLASCSDTSTSSNMAANYLLSSTTLSCALVIRKPY